VGVAHKMLDLAAAHAGMREQFGRVIGSYQAVSHQIADTYVALELARSLTTWACWAIDADDATAAMAAAAAKADATTAAVRACEMAIQVHGGLGFTWDSMLHRYYKRAQWLESFGGSAPAQRASVAAGLLDG
jgi:alkylation response protein AidB-like acyl-CoA dehydrogenase